MTHTSLILARLKSGKSITAALAYDRYGIMRLASRVFELRQRGHAIRSTLVRRDNKSWARYSLT